MALSLAPAFHCPAPFARLRPATATATTTRPAVSRPSTPPPILRQGIAAEPGALCSNALQCQHFQECSGCSHETALDCPPLLSEAKKFFVRRGISDLSFDSGLLWGWRCRAKLAVRGSAKEPMIGLYEEGSHNVVDIPFCKAHHPSINAAVELLKQGISLFNVQPYDEDSGTGELRYVQMAVTTYDTSVPAFERYLKGAGVIGLSLAVTRNCKTVKCLEVNKEAKLSFERSISRLHHTDVAMEPLYWLEGSDVVVVDPPRKGLHPSLIEALQKFPSSSKKAVQMTGSSTRKREEKRPWVLQAREACAELNNSSIDKGQSWPHTIIYISCGWESFKKDCDSLVSSKIGRLENAHAFNFFPGTKSIEILAVFKRGGLSSQKEKKKKKGGEKKRFFKERSL